MRISPLLAVAFFAAPFSAATAQSVTTAPVGAVSTTIGVGITPIGITLLNPDLVSAKVVSAAANTLTLNVSGIGGLLASGEPYYLEVYGGDLKGDRFDVDTAATITANNNTVVLDGVSAENTFDIGGVGSLLDNVSVRIRKHVTIEQFQQSIVGALVGSSSATLADQINIFDNNASAYISYYLRADGVTWRRVGSTVVVNKNPIYPGKGVFFLKRNSSVQITSIGYVRTNDFVQKFGEGLQLLANPWPTDFSPNDLHAISANGWTGNGSAALADQLHVYDPNINAYLSYFLRADGVTWRRIGSTVAVSDTKLFVAGSSFFVQRHSPDAGFLYVNNLGL